MHSSRRGAMRRIGLTAGIVSMCLGVVLGFTAVSASATVNPTFNGFEATGNNSFASGSELKPKCPEAILDTPGSDPSHKRLGDGFDPEAFEPGDAIPYLYTDFTTASTKTFKLQDCVVSFPEDFFVPEDFDADHQLTNDSFKKNDLAKAATELDSAQLVDFTNTTANGEDFTYSWNSPADLEPGLWVCNIARDVAINHGNKGDSEEVGNRKATPVCFQVPTDEEQPSSGITVVKTNDANDDGIFHDHETAPGAGADVDFRFTIKNNGEAVVTIDDITDAWPGHDAAEIEGLVCTGMWEPEVSVDVDDTELPFYIAGGQTVTCNFTVVDYSPPAGDSLTNTVEASGTVGEENEVSDHDTSIVDTPDAGCQRNCGGGGSHTPTPPPSDVCDNIAGAQSEIPAGLVYDENLDCVEVAPEVLALTPEAPLPAEVLPEVLVQPPVLPFTGSNDTGRNVALAGAMLAIGSVLVLGSRKRRSES